MFDTIKNYLSFRNITILSIIIIFLIVGVYAYKTYVSSKINPTFVENNEYITEEQEGEVELFFFFTSWCPHCKTARPEWEKLRDEYQDKTINNTKIIFKEVDCDKDEATAEEFKVEGYPTIKMVKGNQIIEYNAKPNYDNLLEFLHTTL